MLNARPHPHGFTIIECLLAGVVLAIFGSAMTMTIGQALSSSTRALDQRTAAQHLNDVLTRIDLIGPHRLQLEGPLEGELDERFTWAATIEQEPASDLYRVRVTIRWQVPRGERSVQAHTFYYDPPGSRATLATWEDLS